MHSLHLTISSHLYGVISTTTEHSVAVVVVVVVVVVFIEGKSTWWSAALLPVTGYKPLGWTFIYKLPVSCPFPVYFIPA